jgi:hypothetical protein
MYDGGLLLAGSKSEIKIFNNTDANTKSGYWGEDLVGLMTVCVFCSEPDDVLLYFLNDMSERIGFSTFEEK